MAFLDINFDKHVGTESRGSEELMLVFLIALPELLEQVIEA